MALPLDKLLATLGKEAVFDALRAGNFTTLDPRQKTAITRLAIICSAFKTLKVFDKLYQDFVKTGDLLSVQPVTVLCREPEGELGEIHMYEVQPRTLTVDDPKQCWNRAVCWFMWHVLKNQAHQFYISSHSPESRMPPSHKHMANISPAQLAAKHRAVNFLLKSVFTNNNAAVIKLHTDLGCSPWKHMLLRTQTFCLEHKTVGYVRIVLDCDAVVPVIKHFTRSIMSYTEITLPALARAALYLNQDTEFIVLLEGFKDKMIKYSSVFVVSSTLLCIENDGDAVYNKLMGIQ